MTDLSSLRLRDDVSLAAEVVPPAWPLSSVIAVNPLAGFEDQPFEDALADAGRLFGASGLLSMDEYRAALHSGRIDEADLRAALERRIGWAAPDELDLLLADLIDGPTEPAPVRLARTVAEEHDRRHGTRLCEEIEVEVTEWWLHWTAQHPATTDRSAGAHGEGAHGEGAQPPWPAWVAERWPGRIEDPLAALADALARLRVPHYAQRDYLARHLALLPGWVGHLRWREQQGDEDDLVLAHLAISTTVEADLVDGATWYTDDGPLPRTPSTSIAERAGHLADRAIHGEVDLERAAATLAMLPGPARLHVWHDAYERAVHDRLLSAMAVGPAPAPRRPDGDRPAAQVVCCIDVRSEGLRRHLEAFGHETFGYAGFFGLAARFVPASGHGATDRCPVLIAPAVELHEHGRTAHHPHPDPAATRASVASLQRHAALDDAWHDATHHPIAPLAVAEATGWLAGPIAAARTFAPAASAAVADRLRGRRSPAAAVDRSGVPLRQQADVVAGVLRLGIGARPAPLVVLCGHDARADNTPLESGLACGACGGNGGGPSAQAVAAMANDPAVRTELARRGTPIPDATWFLAAIHETGSDRVELLDQDLVPASHRDAVDALVRDLDAAGEASALERADALPGRRRRPRRQRARARDWAEPVPEAGLAGNMAFVIAPRSRTAHLQLDRRVFLHSYEPDQDADGAVLNGILTAPLVVGQWINAQYSASTTDPEHFGSGSKVVHNPVGDIGVLSGPGGDLRRGLALQSVRCGDRLLHEPVRLLAVVEGNLDHIDAAIAGSATLRRLVEHEWIHLVARTGPDQPWQQRTALGWLPRPTGAWPQEAAA